MNTVMERRLAAATSVKTAKRRAALRMPPQEYCGRHLPLSEHRHLSPNTTGLSLVEQGRSLGGGCCVWLYLSVTVALRAFALNIVE